MKKVLPVLFMLALGLSSCSDFKKGFEEEMAKDETTTDSLKTDADTVQTDTTKTE